MGSKKGQAIWFGVRSGDERWSATWKLWAKTSGDVYLAGRAMGRWFKLSLHKSGIWRAAWTNEISAVSTGEDRAIAKWRRPGPFTEGWTQGPSILIGNVGQKAPLALPDAGRRRPVIWSEPPPPSHGLYFTVLFSPDSAHSSGIHRVLHQGDGVVGGIEVYAGGSVWIVTRLAPLFSGDRERIEQHLREVRIHLKPGGDPESIDGASLLEIADDSRGLPLLLDVALGRENVIVDGAT